jgi:hypothetical protein
LRVDLQQLEFIDKKLRIISREIEDHFRVEFEVASLYRIGDDGVHGTLPLRGTDLGCKVQAFGDLVSEFINSRWVYDPARPEKVCCRCHKTKTGELHLHLQVHPNTVRR